MAIQFSQFTLSERARHGCLVLGVPLFTLALAQLFFTPRFQSNDDVGMNLIAAGVMLSPSPSGHVLFMSNLLGEPLSFLYTHCPGIPWYFLFMQGSMLLAGCAITDAALSRGVSFMRLIGLAGFLLFVGLPFFVMMQFTQVAALSACAAIVVWYSRDNERPWTPASVTLFVALCLLGAVVRHDSCGVVGLLALPLIALEAGRRFGADRQSEQGLAWRPWQSAGVRSLALLALGAGVGGACVGAQKAIDSLDPGWRGFSTYNIHRAQFNDFNAVPYNKETKPAFDSAGWSKNDFDMLLTFFFADPEVYSLENYQQIIASCPPRPMTARSVRSQWPLLQYQFRHDLFAPLLAAILLPAFLLPRSKLAWAKYLGTVLALFVVWYYLLVVLNRCPSHVLHSMMAFVAAAVLIVASARSENLNPSWRSITLGLLAFALLAGPSFLALRASSKQAVIWDRAIRDEVRCLHPRSDQLFVTWGSSFQYEWILTRRGFRELRDFKMFPLGCCANTPITDERLREFGITDLITAIFERDDVFVICTDDLAGMLVTYIREHRGVDTQFRQTYVSAYFTVYQFSRISH